MAATHYGLGPGEWDNTSDFNPRRDARGIYTASVTFTMLDGTWEGSGYLAFARGTAITALDSDINSFWDFLKVEEVDLQRREGGYVDAIVTAVGQNEAEYESDRDVVYTLNGTRKELSILTHPIYRKEVSGLSNDKYFTPAYNNGLYIQDPRQDTNRDTEIDIFSVVEQAKVDTITPPEEVKWWKLIFRDGYRTWLAPALEWTKETANLSGLGDDDLEDLGLISEPEGPYPQIFFGERDWLKSSATDIRSSDSSSNTLTWEMSPFGGYNPVIYGFDPSDVPPPTT